MNRIARFWIRQTNRRRLWRFLPCPIAHRWDPDYVGGCWMIYCRRCGKGVLLEDQTVHLPPEAWRGTYGSQGD